jgi:hypothetical protein
MKKNYSEDDLLNYIYKETSPEDSLNISKEIEENDLVRKQYVELLEGIELLNKTYFRPSEISLHNIMAKAKDSLQQKVD